MGNKKKSESGFLVQGSILAIASIISRIIGLLYRVPLTAIIGNNGNSYYSCAYEIYSMLLLISSYSLPMAVSKLVSARVAKGDFKNAFKVFKGAFLFAVCSGIVAMLIVFFGAEMITRLMKTPLSIFALKVLAPTLVVMAVLGVMRGFFQGLGTMMPSAVSQIIEQIINAIVSVWAAYLLADYGNKVGAVLGNGEDYAAAYGAAGGTLGTALGAVFALLFSIFVFATYVPVFKNRMNNSRTKKNESYGSIMRILIMTIVPVLLSTTIYNISSVIDQGIYKNVALLQGSTNRQMDELWGIFSGKYKVLINVPISIASAMAASCVPSLAAAYAKKDAKLVRSRINSSIRFIMVIAFPCAVGIGVLASPIDAAVIRGRRQRNRTDASDRSRIYRVLFSVDVNECIIAGSKPDAGTGKKCVDCVSTAYYRSACLHVWTEPWYLFRGHRQCVFCTLYVYFEQTLAQKVHKIPSGGWKDIYRTGNFLGDHGCRSIFCL